jgi:hypothetical protein
MPYRHKGNVEVKICALYRTLQGSNWSDSYFGLYLSPHIHPTGNILIPVVKNMVTTQCPSE